MPKVATLCCSRVLTYRSNLGKEYRRVKDYRLTMTNCTDRSAAAFKQLSKQRIVNVSEGGGM